MHVVILTVILQSCVRFSSGNIELGADYGNYFDTIQNDKFYAKRDKEEEAKILSISQEYYLGTATKPTAEYDFTTTESNQIDDRSSQTVGYVRKGTNFRITGTDSERIQNGHDIAEKRELNNEDEYSQETSINIAKGFGTNIKKQMKKYNKDNFGLGQPILSKKIEGINEYKRLKKIGLRSQYSPVNENSSVIGNLSYLDSPRRGVFHSNPAVKYRQDIGFRSKARTASNLNPKEKFGKLKEAFKKVGLSGKRRSYDDDFEDYFVGGEEDMVKFSERSRANLKDPGKYKFKLPRGAQEIMKPEKGEFNDYQDYKRKQELRNPPKISQTSSPTTTKIRHGRAPEPSTKTTPKLLNDIESSLLGPNILRQGPSDYKDFNIDPDPDIGIVPDAALGGGFAPRGGLGKGFLPGVPDILKNPNGKFNNDTNGFRGGNELLRAINGPTRYGPAKNLIDTGPGDGSVGFFQYRPGDSPGGQHHPSGGGGRQPFFQNSPRFPADTGEFGIREGGPIGSKPGFFGGPGKSGFSFPGGNRPDMPRGLLSAVNFGPGEMKHGLPIGPNFSSGTYALGSTSESRPRFPGNPGGRSGPGLLAGPSDSGLNFPDGIRPPGLEGGLGQFHPEGIQQGQAGIGGQYSSYGGDRFGPGGGRGQFGPGDGQFGPRGSQFSPGEGRGQFGPDGGRSGQFRPGGGQGGVEDGPYGVGGLGPGDGRGDQFGADGRSAGQFGPGVGGGIQFGPDGGSGGQFGPGVGGGVQYGSGVGDQFSPSGGGESQFGLGGGGGSEFGRGGKGGGPFGPDGEGAGFMGPGGGGGDQFGPGGRENSLFGLDGGIGGQFGPGGRDGIQPGPGNGGGGQFEPGSGGHFGLGGKGEGQFGPDGGVDQFRLVGGAGGQFGSSGGDGSQYGPGGESIRGGQFGPGGGGGDQFGPGGRENSLFGLGGGDGGQFGPGGRGEIRHGPGGGNGGQFEPGSGGHFGLGGRGEGQFGPSGGGNQFGLGGGAGGQFGPGGGGGSQYGPGGKSIGGGQFGPGGGGASQLRPGAEGRGGGQFGPGGDGARQFGPGAEGGGGGQFGPGGGGRSQVGPGGKGGAGGQYDPGSSGGSHVGPGGNGGGGGQYDPGSGGRSQVGSGNPGSGGGSQVGPGNPGSGGGSQVGPGNPGSGGGSQVGPGNPGSGGGSQVGPGGNPGSGGGNQVGPGSNPGSGGGSQVGPSGNPGSGGGSQVGPEGNPGSGGGSQVGPGGSPGSGGGSQVRPGGNPGSGGGSQVGPGGGGGSPVGPGGQGGGGGQYDPGGGGINPLGPGGKGGEGGLNDPGAGGGSQVGSGGGGGSQVGPGGGGGSQVGPGGSDAKPPIDSQETTPEPIITENFPEEEIRNMTTTTQVSTTTESDAVVLQKFIAEYTSVGETSSAFREKIKKKMTQNNEGYMSAFLISFFKMLAMKKDADVKVIKIHFQPVIEGLYDDDHLFFFGEPLIKLVREYVENVGLRAADQVKEEATLAHYAMTHRNDSLSKDLNGLINYADALYLEDEGEQIIHTLYTLDQYPNHTTYDPVGRIIKPKNMHQILKDLSKAVVITPFKRLEGSLKRKILVEALNRYVVNRFMPGQPIYIPEAYRRHPFNESSSVNKTNALEHVNKTKLEIKERRRMNPFKTGDTIHDTSKLDKQISQKTGLDIRKMIPKYDNYWQRNSNKQFSIYSEHPKIYEKYISKINKHKYDNTIRHNRNLHHKYEYLMDIQRMTKLRNNYSKLTYFNEYEKNKANQRHRRENYDRGRKLNEKDTIDNDQYLLEENKEINKKNGTKYALIESKRFRLVGNKNKQKIKPERATVESKINRKPYINKMYFAKVAQNNKEFRHTTSFKNIKFQNENDIKHYKNITRSPSAKIILFKPRLLGRKIISKYKHYLREQRKPGKDEIIKQITELSSYSSEEDELKWNLRGASFHGNRKFMNPSRGKFITNHRSNKKIDINLSSSGTDEEHILKSKIHKYFGLHDKIQQ